MGKAIGIDLGTTNTAIAVLVDGRPRVLEDDKGYKVLPSCVTILEDGETIVGLAARNLALTKPDRTVQAVKRLIGRHFDSPEVDRIRRRAGYTIKPAPDGSCLVEMAGRTFTPLEVSALILQHARSIAERAFGEAVDEAVITVPAHFNHAQRAATLEAARMAGLRCDRLLNEPTAAALAYGFRKEVNRTILIYDLGGGTFDVSVLQLSEGVYEVLSTSGDTFLGGEDFDHRLVDHLAESFQSEHGVDLRTDRAALQRLKDAAERAKCELSFTDRTTVLIPRIHGSHNLELEVTRLTLEGRVDDLVEKTLQITRQAVTDAGLRISDIGDVILVGGQTRMPRVREAIGSLFQKEPSRSVHPEEVVAIGAAVHAHSLVDPSASKPLLLDVTPFDLGIDVAGGLFQPIITKNSHVPASASRTFATAHDNQDNVQVTVRQGESRFASENEFLGRFVMSGLTPAPRMSTKVEVNFRLDSNGMLHVASTEPATGERKRITIRNYAEIAQTEGKVEASIEGDATTDPSAVLMTAEAAAPGAAPPKAGAEKKGLMGRLFGRKGGGKKSKSKKAATPAGGGAERIDTPPMPLAAMPEAPPTWEDVAGAEPVALADSQLAPVDLAPMPAPAHEPVHDPMLDPEPLEVGSLQMLEPESAEPLPLGAMDDIEPLDAGAYGALMEADEPTMVEVDPFAGGGSFGSDDGFGASLDDPFAQDAQPAATRAVHDPFADAAPASDPFADSRSADELDDDDPFADAFMDALDEVAPEPVAAPDEPEDERTDPEGFALPLADEDDLAAALAEAAAEQTAPIPRPKRRKPAKLKLAYPRADAMVEEYRENLRRGGCFIRTEKPLKVGRECRIEVRAPGLDQPIQINGVVTWSSAGQTNLAPGQSAGMGIEYRLDPSDRADVEQTLSGLAPEA